MSRKKLVFPMKQKDMLKECGLYISPKKPESVEVKKSRFPMPLQDVLTSAFEDPPVQQPAKIAKMYRNPRKNLFKVPPSVRPSAVGWKQKNSVQKKSVSLKKQHMPLKKQHITTNSGRKKSRHSCDSFIDLDLGVQDTNLTEILKRIGKEIEENRKLFKEFCMRHEDSMNNIKKLLENVEQIYGTRNVANDSLQPGKENVEPNRRSPRLTSILTSNLSASPLVHLNDNSEANLLMKSLKKNVHFQRSDPQKEKLIKAMEFYNTVRSDFAILCTPKHGEDALNEGSINPMEIISRTIQNQCLMLQDTPMHK